MSKITCFTDEKRHRVYVQSVPVCSGTTRTCVSTCARGAGTHGDVLNLRTEGFFLRAKPRHTPHHTKHTHTHTTNHAHQHATTHGDRDRERRQGQREKRRRKRRDKRRQKKTRQDKRREKIHFQCGGAWPFFVDVVIFWLIPFAHET